MLAHVPSCLIIHFAVAPSAAGRSLASALPAARASTTATIRIERNRIRLLPFAPSARATGEPAPRASVRLAGQSDDCNDRMQVIDGNPRRLPRVLIKRDCSTTPQYDGNFRRIRIRANLVINIKLPSDHVIDRISVVAAKTHKLKLGRLVGGRWRLVEIKRRSDAIFMPQPHEIMNFR